MHATTLFKVDAGTRVIHERKSGGPVARIGRNKTQLAQRLHRLVAVVPGGNQSKRCTVIDTQRLTIQTVSNEYTRIEQVFERQAGASAILGFQGDQRR